MNGYKRYEKVNKKVVNSLGSLAEGIEDLRVDVFQVSLQSFTVKEYKVGFTRVGILSEFKPRPQSFIG